MILSGQEYRCSKGETFDSIALVVYGDEKHACELLHANPMLCTVPVFSGGEALALPVVEVLEDEEEGEDGYMPAVAPWKE